MPREWNDSVLDSLRLVGDPEADDAIGEYIESHAEVTARTVMTSLVHSLRVGDAAITPKLRQYLDDRGALPSWADPQLVAAGQAVFAARGLEIATALFCASLPTAYAAERGARVINTTAELVTDPHRRIAETAQMICDVMSMELRPDEPDTTALGPGTRGYDAARGVRLMHAAVRHLVRCEPGGPACPVVADETPVNQEDLLGTLLTFTVVVFDAVAALGVPLSVQEQVAYLHTWCVVGALLGIRDDLLPLSLPEARALDTTIRMRQNGVGVGGAALADALVAEMRSKLVPGFRHLPDALVRRLAGNVIADLLGVPASTPAMRLFVTLTANCTRVWHRVAPARFRRTVGGRASRSMIAWYVDRPRGARPPWDFSGLQGVGPNRAS